MCLDRPAEGVALLTLNRPDRLNAITVELQRELDEALRALADDEATRCVVLTGAGERAFSAGYDLDELASWSDDELRLALSERERWLWNIAATPVPVIAALNGLAYGAGALIAAAVDVRLGCPETVLRFTAAAYGGANATWSLPALVGHARAAELLLTAREVGASEAAEMGLLHRVVAREELLDAALVTASRIASNPAAGTRAIKRLLREHVGRGLAERFEAESVVMRTELRPRAVGHDADGEDRARIPRRPRHEEVAHDAGR
jgi:enoyl-CoA hydratase/carnithine racemase